MPDLRAHGVRPVLIGNGSLSQARRVRDELNLPDDLILLTDPERTSYAGAGLKRNLAGVFNADTLRAGMRAWSAGARTSGLQGDPLQLGGVIGVSPDGTVRYRYASSYAGDHPPLKQALAALA